MGGAKSFSGGAGGGTLTKREWKQTGTVGGMKVLTRVVGDSVSLPTYASTPNSIYASYTKSGKPKQISFHEGGRETTKTIDLDHSHKKVKVHVHEWKNGVRQDGVRAPTAEETTYIDQLRKM
jgi:hypothetical protein